MSKSSRFFGALAAVLLLASSSALWAQTTGRIQGQVVDAQGAAVPGATVTVTSPALQGLLTQVSDGEGRFRFPSVPPGRYAVKSELSSFKTVELKDVEVGLDRTATVPITMQLAGVSESVTVLGTTPVIDSTSTITGVVAGAEILNRIPVRRDIYSATRFSAGVVDDAVGPTVYGSSGAENQYIIDGLNTTGVELGNKGKNVNMDFIEQVETKTGGLPAEYGRNTGGIVNAVTKSGSNVFRGSAFGFTEGGFLSADDSTRDERPQTTTQVTDTSHRADIGGTLGGFIVKDKLWFFGSVDYADRGIDTTVIRTIESPGSPAINSVVPSTITNTLFAAKLTYKLGQGHTLNGSVYGDPTTLTGNIFAISGPSSTWEGERKTGGTDLVGKYDGVFGSKWLISGQAARHSEKEENFGNGRTIPLSIDTTINPNALSGGFGFFQDQEFTRDVYKADVSTFFGPHSVKGGIDYEHVKAVNNNYNGGGGQRIYKLTTSGGTIYYRHRFYVNDRAPGYVRSDPASWQIAVPLTSEPDSQNTAWYVQDSWRIGSSLTFNGGIRWEGQDVRNRDGESAFKLTDNWAPRIGFTWDPTRNGKSKLYANWGRFFESIPMDINIRSFGGEVQCFCYNLSPDPANYLQAANAPRGQALLGGPTPADPNLKGQYLDEFLVGYDYEIKPSFVIGAKFTKRDLGRVIEDFLIPSEGSYFIANPATGIGGEMGFYDGVHTATAPKAKRESTAFEVTASKRFGNNWQFLASAVFAKLEGNYDGTFQNSTGQLDPNINSAFDYADFLVNADGKLSNDRNVQLKFDGSYEFSKGAISGLNVGLSYRWLAGTPLNAYGYSLAYQNWEYYLVPRGSLGRGPSDWETDLNLSYPIRFGGQKRLSVIADIFNLFNRQSINQFDERYNLISDGECGGIPTALCNGDGGMATGGDNLIPVGTLSNPRATASNPDYLKKGIGFTQPFSLRFGVRFMF
jgi:Carboxypeptidase regulatory-like domain